MKKVLRYIIHNRKKIIKAFVMVGIAGVLFAVAHKIGTAERGYKAIGGEIFIPLIVLLAKPIGRLIKESVEVVKKCVF